MRHLDERDASRSLLLVEPGDDLLVELDKLADERRWSIALLTGGGVFELVELLLADGTTKTLENAEVIQLVGTLVSSRLDRATVLRVTVISEGLTFSGQIRAAVVGSMLISVDASTASIDATGSIKPKRRIVELPENPPPPMAERTWVEPASEPPASEPDDGLALHSRNTPPHVPSTISEPPFSAPDDSLVLHSRNSPPHVPSTISEPPISAPKPPSKTFTAKPIPRRVATTAPWIDEDEVMPEPGDYLDHPQLGLCLVEGEDSAGRTTIKVPSGRRRTLQLSALKVLPLETDEEGRRVYKIIGPKPRY